MCSAFLSKRMRACLWFCPWRFHRKIAALARVNYRNHIRTSSCRPFVAGLLMWSSFGGMFDSVHHQPHLHHSVMWASDAGFGHNDGRAYVLMLRAWNGESCTFFSSCNMHKELGQTYRSYMRGRAIKSTINRFHNCFFFFFCTSFMNFLSS